MATPSQSAREVLDAQGQLTPDVIAVRADGEVFDLHSPVPEGAELEIIKLTDEAGLAIIRHSTAHVLADAVQRLYPGTKITFGPAIEGGFYYDFDRPDGQFSEADFEAIESKMKEIAAADHGFERVVMERGDARKMLEDMAEHYKVEHLERLEGEITVYKHGDWVDLCKGPHVPSTGYLRAVKLTHVSGAYWRGDERNPMLQRIYGTAFPSPKELRAHLKAIEEAKKRDHRKVGPELGLIGFHRWAPASPFFLPRGTEIYNSMVEYVRGLYGQTGYQEVITPQVFSRELFETSGHYPTYAENGFYATTNENLEDVVEAMGKGKAYTVESLAEEMRYGVKPMNCPGHCLMFGMTRRSYRELPMRLADFGRLHRFERSGVTQGLTRVRTFSQDDGHIFCTRDQALPEILAFLDLVRRVYEDFGFAEMRIVVATRPDERLGEDADWEHAERVLIDAAEQFGRGCEIAEGEGAFYGPKIEFHLKDALGRPWQLGTIQFDFNLPARFELSYIGEDNSPHQPVMLHRAILGSVERFFAILVEHTAGAFPTWLSPEQVAILTVSEKVNDYAEEARDALLAAGVRAVADLSADKLGAKIRRARNLRVPYLAVVGPKEAESRSVSVRSRDEGKELGVLPLDTLRDRILAEGMPPSLRTG